MKRVAITSETLLVAALLALHPCGCDSGTAATPDASAADADAAKDADAGGADAMDAQAVDTPCADAGVPSCDAGAAMVTTCDACAPPTVLATCQESPIALTVDGADVTWADQGVQIGGGGKLPPVYAQGSVMRCAKTGCGGAPSPIAAPLARAWPHALATSGSAAYFVAGVGDAGATALLRADVGSCTSTPDVWLDAVPYLMATDGTALYYTTSSAVEVFTCALAGCVTPTLLWKAPNPNQATTGIAVDATDVYWGTQSGELYRCAKTGCGGNPTLLGSTAVVIGALALDATSVYATGQAGVVRCAKTGCGVPTVISGQAGWESSIATDGVDVYWTRDNVYACPVTGCNGAPRELATSTAATGIALDGSNVYWTDRTLGAVLSVPK